MVCTQIRRQGKEVLIFERKKKDLTKTNTKHIHLVEREDAGCRSEEVNNENRTEVSHSMAERNMAGG